MANKNTDMVRFERSLLHMPALQADMVRKLYAHARARGLNVKDAITHARTHGMV